MSSDASSSTRSPHVPLSQDREVSSIPKTNEGKWVYPSEAQFFAAMARKHHNPNAADMRSIVPIHNAVNERAWSEILGWEAGKGGDACGGVKLVNFKGRPGDRSPKSRLNTLLGYLFIFISMFCSHLINFVIGILLPLTVMTGLSNAVALGCAILLISTLVGTRTRVKCLFILMLDLH